MRISKEGVNLKLQLLLHKIQQFLHLILPQHSVINGREVGVRSKLVTLNSVFAFTLTYGHESWVMTK